MSSSKRHSYLCKDCGETSLFAKQPKFCPFCGSQTIARNTEKSKRHAEETIEKMNAMLPQINDAWDTYAELYVQFESMRQILAPYANRGIIDKNLIPKIEHKNLTDVLSEYRKRRKANE